jgi:hypothetical protein
VKLKNFDSYSRAYSKDPKRFAQRVAIASPTAKGLEMFRVVKTANEAFNLEEDLPIIPWNNFSFSSSTINENFHNVIYNREELPDTRKLRSDFRTTEFIPSSIKDRSLVKKMKFPITGINKNGETDFKTYGKFKKSEDRFDEFQEKIVPLSRFEILAVGGRPLHAQKRVNKIPFDVDLSRFKYLDESLKICKKINEKYRPDFYLISLLESGGKVYLESVSRDCPLTPSQGLRMYEAAYENHYNSKIPNWFKKEMFDSHVKPYYKKRYYDSLLLKPTGIIDLEKYLG